MVIRRALEEANGTYIIQPTTRVEKREVDLHRKRLRNEARLWLTTDTFGLRVIFDLADFPGGIGYLEFIKKMKERLKNDAGGTIRE